MSVFGGLEDNAPDGGLFGEPVEQPWETTDEGHVYGDPASVAGNAGSGYTAPSSAEPSRSASANLQKPINVNDTNANTNDYDNGLNESTKPAPNASTSKATADYTTDATNANTTNVKKRRRLTITVTAIEATKTEPIVWFDVQTTLPRFRNPTYCDVRRTHQELQRFATHLTSANPECFVPALPPSSNAYPSGSSESSEQLRVALQKWFDRICRSALLASDPEFLYFVEATTGYVPLAKSTARATGLQRKMLKQLAPPPDNVPELRDFRPQAKLLHTFALESKQRLDQVAKERRSLGSALNELAQGIHARAAGDSRLGPACDRVARALNIDGDVQKQLALAEEAAFGDTIALIASDAYIVKETLTNRHLLMRDLQKAQKSTESRHADATQLKGDPHVAPGKLNDAITQLESASFLENRIGATVRRVSDHLLAQKRVFLSRVEQDVLEAVGQCALKSIEQARRELAAWEDARAEVRAADPRGGLARLGRDAPLRPRARSQAYSGDDWSDRSARALGTRHVEPVPLAPPVTPAAQRSVPEVLDQRRAAALLSETYTV